jgi:dihydrofolate reductase
MNRETTGVRSSVFIATSLDGFIAREDGGIDWLPPVDDGSGKGDDYGYGPFFDSVDTLVMGRNTFELVRTFGSWPYGDRRVVVLTTRPLEVPEWAEGRVEAMSGPVREVVRRLAERGAAHLYVDGGKTVQSFLAEGLIQRMVVSRIPVLLGRGIPLFGPLPGDVRLRHVATRAYDSGLVQSEYEVEETGA